MASSADTKLAVIGVLITLHPDDAARILTMSLHLLAKRNRERAAQVRLSFDRDDS